MPVIDLNEVCDLEDARMDALLEKHPRRTMLLRLTMDLAQGVWVEQYEEEDNAEWCDDIGCSFCPKDVGEKFTEWLAKKWAEYVKSRERKERRPQSIQLDVQRWMEFERKFGIESNVRWLMLHTFGPLKRMKFDAALVPLIKERSKRSTWRLDDEKDLAPGDLVECINASTGERFAIIEITEVRLTIFANLTDAEKAEHESFPSEEAMLATYSRYYQKPISRDYPLKIIKFYAMPEKKVRKPK